MTFIESWRPFFRVCFGLGISMYTLGVEGIIEKDIFAVFGGIILLVIGAQYGWKD